MTHRSRFLAMLFLCNLLSWPAFAEGSNTEKSNPPLLSPTELWVGGGVLLGTLALYSEDSRIQRGVPSFLNHRSSRKLGLEYMGKYGSFFEQIGNVEGPLAVAGGYYIVGLCTHSPYTMKTGSLSLESYAVNGVLVLAIKEVVGRSRPVNVRDFNSRKFRPLSGQASFPSGHTSTAFALATVVSQRSDSCWVGAGAYTLAGLVGAGRIFQNQHWPSDVLAAGLLGYFSGKLTIWMGETKGWGLGPADNGRGLAVRKKF